jgi:hypothetical protein
VTDVVGVELASGVVRAIALGAWGRTGAAAELDWDPERPEAAVALLRARLGSPRRIALAVGLAFLHPKRVQLPPAAWAERRSILALEPDRFFPVHGPVLVSLVDEAELAFAADAEQVARWVRAFEDWAPVESVEPAPLAAARMVARASAEGAFAVPAGPGELGVIAIQGGRLASARRVPEGQDAPAASPLPAVPGAAADYAIAFGAARGVDGPLDAMLLPDRQAARTRSRRLGRVGAAAAACALTTVLALWALDQSRERTLAALDEEITRATSAAEPAVALRDSLGALDLEAEALRGLGGASADPLGVLAVLSERLPPGAVVLSLRSTGADWQIDGTAADAAALVPLLDQDERFQDVRVLAASTRFREGERTYETFSIGFRAAAPSD